MSGVIAGHKLRISVTVVMAGNELRITVTGVIADHELQDIRCWCEFQYIGDGCKGSTLIVVSRCWVS